MQNNVDVYIGIDPGISGAMAVIEVCNNAILSVSTYAYNEGVYKQVLQQHSNVRSVVIENVHAMPGQGVVSTFTFGRNFGFTEGLAFACDLPYSFVSPRKWKKYFNVTADKATSIAKAQELYEDVSLLRTPRSRKPNDGIAEAILLATYAMENYEREQDG